MAWFDVIEIPLRVIINDITGATYTDSTLQQLIVTAASFVVQEVQLATTYTINFSTTGISPDPSTDNTFINFVVLKAACLTNQWDLGSKANVAGFSAQLGPVKGSVSVGGSQFFDILFNKGSCGLYDQLRLENNLYGPGSANIRGIMSTFTNDTYLPIYYEMGGRPNI